MNDQHAHAGHVGHDTYTGSYGVDPLFGAHPDGQAGYEAGHSGQYDSSQWDAGAHQSAGYDPYAGQEQAGAFAPHEAAAQHGTSGQWDATGSYEAVGQYDTGAQWDASAWNQPAQTGQFEEAAPAFAYDATGQWAAAPFDTGAYDATAWNTAAVGDAGTADTGILPQQFAPEQDFGHEYGTDFTAEPALDAASEFLPDHSGDFAPEASDYSAGYDEHGQGGDFDGAGLAQDLAPGLPDPSAEDLSARGIGDTADLPVITETDPDGGHAPEPELTSVTVAATAAPRSARRSAGGGSRSRRRTPAKRSALFTVAVPSACVMGVAGIAAASVGGLSDGDTQRNETKLAAGDTAADAAKSAAANNKMDTQLAALSAEARDFGDRASRTQERIDLKARQEADRKKREDEAKKREALRPKFALPIKSRGLSTYYGESGVNWMALHTGIDFPVPYGASVFAATDGTIRTQYNSAYGNMIILTAPDGTETWYCHLSSAKIRSGTVKAGDVIGYAGNSGNSTGPHLHFEVRPGGGSTIDPLAWLKSKGLDPT